MLSQSTVTAQFHQLKISLHVTEQAGVVCQYIDVVVSQHVIFMTQM